MNKKNTITCPDRTAFIDVCLRLTLAGARYEAFELDLVIIIYGA